MKTKINYGNGLALTMCDELMKSGTMTNTHKRCCLRIKDQGGMTLSKLARLSLHFQGIPQAGEIGSEMSYMDRLFLFSRREQFPTQKILLFSDLAYQKWMIGACSTHQKYEEALDSRRIVRGNEFLGSPIESRYSYFSWRSDMPMKSLIDVLKIVSSTVKDPTAMPITIQTKRRHRRHFRKLDVNKFLQTGIASPTDEPAKVDAVWIEDL